VVEEAPHLNVAATSLAAVNMAVVGLNPADKLTAPLPESSRSARFSAGPEVNGGSGAGPAAANAPLAISGLTVRNTSGQPAAPSANPILVARAAPTLQDAIEGAAKLASRSFPQQPSSAPEIHLAPPPDRRFIGRDVYTLAVQMPNISSYVGSWIMWFAERVPAGIRGGHDLRPPNPTHKVDPKYYPAAIAERIEGKVQLAGIIRADGRVDSIRVLKGVDPRLDGSAAEALIKWVFEPARRAGVPVEVDVVAEIPFRLAPPVKK
jgi:TonB family protein